MLLLLLLLLHLVFYSVFFFSICYCFAFWRRKLIFMSIYFPIIYLNIIPINNENRKRKKKSKIHSTINTNWNFLSNCRLLFFLYSSPFLQTKQHRIPNHVLLDNETVVFYSFEFPIVNIHEMMMMIVIFIFLYRISYQNDIFLKIVHSNVIECVGWCYIECLQMSKNFHFKFVRINYLFPIDRNYSLFFLFIFCSYII